MLSNMKNFPFLKTGFGKAVSLALVLVFFGSVALIMFLKEMLKKIFFYGQIKIR